MLLSVLTATLMVASSWSPVHRGLWLANMAPVLILLVTLVSTASRFPMTPLAYRALFLGAVVLLTGAYYTFPLVPAGAWAQEHFGLGRNPYDRIAHVMLGATAAVCARELLLRSAMIRPGPWLGTVAICVAVAAGVACELLEWVVAVATQTRADSLFLGVAERFDTNWDMLGDFIGAVLGAFALAPIHDAELARARDWDAWPAGRGDFPLMSTQRRPSATPAEQRKLA